MQEVSEAARLFCPVDKELPFTDETIFDPAGETTGVVQVVYVEDSDTTHPHAGKLRMNFVTLPPDTCILGSAFYPSAIVTVRSGNIEILVEPGPEAPAGVPLPAVSVKRSDGTTDEPAIDAEIAVNQGDWARIKNRSMIGFRNVGTTEAEFLVAGIKPASGPGSGDCGGICRNRP
jgi:hypothetical protein